MCIDPGETSGIAIVYEGKLSLGSIPLDACIPYISDYKPEFILVESRPRFHGWNDALVGSYAALQETTELAGVPIIYITPGLWKPIVKALDWEVPLAKTQHEKDAYNIMRYFFFSHFKLDVGEDICQHLDIIKKFLSSEAG